MPMTKTELINQVAEDTGLTKINAGRALDVTLNVAFDYNEYIKAYGLEQRYKWNVSDLKGKAFLILRILSKKVEKR